MKRLHWTLVFLGLQLTVLPASGITFTPLEANKTYYEVTMSSPAKKSYRGAIVMTMAGQGLPQYFDWSCRSIAASQELFDLLVFHEDNMLIENTECAANVIKISLGKGGLAELISKALVFPLIDAVNIGPPMYTEADEVNQMRLQRLLEVVLDRMPYILAEFKPATGAIFERYLKKYTHWTYTDPDIFWGNVAQWVTPQELHTFDIITFGKINDASRLFMRGQFTLHKNNYKMNWIWRRQPHIQIYEVLRRLSTIIAAWEHNIEDAKVKKALFVSAEGAYSTAVMEDTSLVILITGRMFSDKNTHAVVWENGQLYRCFCNNYLFCIHNTTNTFNKDACLPPDISPTPHVLPPMVVYEESVSNEQCGMNWLGHSHRRCIPRLQNKMMNEAIYYHGKWYVNDETIANRLVRHTTAMFHFRVWEDMLSTQIISDKAVSSNCFITYLNMPMSAMVVHECGFDKVKRVFLAGGAMPNTPDALRLMLFKQKKDQVMMRHSNKPGSLLPKEEEP